MPPTALGHRPPAWEACSVSDLPSRNEMLPHVQSEPPLVQLWTMGSRGGELSTSLPVSPPQEAAESHEVAPQPPPNSTRPKFSAAPYRSTCVCDTWIFWGVLNNIFSVFIDLVPSASRRCSHWSCKERRPCCPHELWLAVGSLWPGACSPSQECAGPTTGGWPCRALGGHVQDLGVSNT